LKKNLKEFVFLLLLLAVGGVFFFLKNGAFEKKIAAAGDAMEKGEFRKACTLFERLHSKAASRLGRRSRAHACFQADYAACLEKAGRDAQALEHYRRALDIVKLEKEPPLAELIALKLSLARLTERQVGLAAALEIYRSAEDLVRRMSDPLVLFETLAKKGEVQKKMHKTGAARKTFYQALRVAEECLPPEHPRVISTIRSLERVRSPPGEEEVEDPAADLAFLAGRDSNTAKDRKAVYSRLVRLGTIFRNRSDDALARYFLKRVAELDPASLPAGLAESARFELEQIDENGFSNESEKHASLEKAESLFERGRYAACLEELESRGDDLDSLDTFDPMRLRFDYLAGICLYELGKTGPARSRLENAWAGLKEERSLDERIRFRLCGALGLLYADRGEQQKALDFLKKAFVLEQMISVPLPEKRVRISETLGNMEMARGNVNNASDAFLRALRVLEYKPELRTERYAEILRRQAFLCGIQGQESNRQKWSDRAMELERSLLPRAKYPEALSVVLGYHGAAEIQAGRYEHAKPFIKESLDIMETGGAPRVLLYPGMRCHYAALLWAEGSPDESVRLFRRALDGGALYREPAPGDRVDAETLTRDAAFVETALRDIRGRLGGGHPAVLDLLRAQTKHAFLHEDSRKRVSMVFQVHSLGNMIFGQAHHYYAVPYCFTAAKYEDGGQLDKARSWFDKALRDTVERYPPFHPFTALALYNRQRFEADRAGFDAGRFADSLIAAAKKMYPESAANQGDLLFHLAVVVEGASGGSRAAALLEEARKRYAAGESETAKRLDFIRQWEAGT
jgi:tetratricopeptide (TPR) repeat protein